MDISYTFAVTICGGYVDGDFSVQASSADEAYTKAQDAIADALLHLPNNISAEYNVELIYTDADKLFEKELNKALTKYSSDNIDIVYDSELFEYCIAYHSNNNSFKIFGIKDDSMEPESSEDVEKILKEMAEKYNCGYCI